MSIIARTLMRQPNDAKLIRDCFTTSAYYWMSWNKDEITAWVDDEILSARANIANIDKLDQPYSDVYKAYTNVQG